MRYFGVEVYIGEQFADRLRSHFCLELIAILLNGLEITVFRQQLPAFELGHARVNDHVGFKVQYPFYLAQGHVQQQTHP